MNKNEQQLLGYIKGKVEDIDKKLEDVCETVGENVKITAANRVKVDAMKSIVKEHQDKIAKHDVIFGKIGAGIAALIFIITIGINFTFDWIRTKWFN